MKVIVILALLTVAISANAQELIELVKPISARDLSGTVSDSTNAPLAGVLVTRFQCPSNYPHIQELEEPIDRVRTNEKGMFSIPKPNGRTLACLRFQLNGFNQYVIRIHFVSNAPDLRIKLVPAA